ncbi:hypothetical protein B7463_g12528, partial [Scytalidium lignicola]
MAAIQTAFIWISYAVALGLVAFIAAVFTYIYQTPRDRSPLVSIVAILTLTSLLATALLLPVDIALVSSTTSLDAVLCLLVVPFTYFFYEEYDEVEAEEGTQSVGKRSVGALKYTLIFVALVVILFIVGFFAPVARDRKGAHFDLDYFKQLLAENHGERALTFALGLLITLGTFLYVLYTGAGLALLPISFIKSAPAVSAPQLHANTTSALETNRERQRQIEGRNAGRSDGMPAKDRRELEALVREERTLVRRERLAAEAMGEGKSRIVRAWAKLASIFRPLKLLGGILLLVLAILIWVSMLITGVDKAKNSICKQHCGYILGRINIFQPINWIFVQSSRAFPTDYVLMGLLVIFFFSSSVAGIAAVGIRFLWIRIFEIRKSHTSPQALLMATVMLALIILAINYSIAMIVAPQYSIYGAQKFCSAEPSHLWAKPNCSNHPELIRPCSELSGNRAARDICTPSVVSTFLNRVTVNFPIFGLLSFWAQFGFLAIFLIVFVTSLFRTPKLDLSELDRDAEADEEEGLLASTGRRFGATWQDIRGKAKRSDGAAGRRIRGDDYDEDDD